VGRGCWRASRGTVRFARMAHADGSDVRPDCTFGPNGQSVQVEHTLGAYIGAIRPAPMPLVVDTFPLRYSPSLNTLPSPFGSFTPLYPHKDPWGWVLHRGNGVLEFLNSHPHSGGPHIPPGPYHGSYTRATLLDSPWMGQTAGG